MAKNFIFDWKGTLYDGQSRELIAGAMNVLEYFDGQETDLYLLGKDEVGDMPGEVEGLKVASFFREIGFIRGSKSEEDLLQFVHTEDPIDTVVVGDRVRSEIAIGNRIGATTVWIASGRFADQTPQYLHELPDHTISSITELIDLSIQQTWC